MKGYTKCSQADKEKIIAFYLSTGATLKELSTKFGYSKTAISGFLTEYLNKQKNAIAA